MSLTRYPQMAVADGFSSLLKAYPATNYVYATAVSVATRES